MNLAKLLTLVGALVVLSFVSCADPITPTLEISPITHEVVVGETVRLTVTRRFPAGPIENITSKVRYTSTSNDIALVHADTGEVEAKNPGTVIIKAHDALSDATVAATLTIAPKRIRSIEVTPTPAIVLARGATQQFTATATYNDNTKRDVTQEVSWSSTNVAAVIVTNETPRGIAKAIAAGDAAILAADGATLVQGRSQVFVTGGGPFLAAILVTPNPGVVGVAKTTAFSAIGVFSDGTSRDLTTTVKWSSSRTDVATVDAGGVTTGVAAGDTTITATGPEPSTTVKGSAALKVSP